MGAGRHLKQCSAMIVLWIVGVLLCGCVSQPQTPPTIELNGNGTFEAIVRDHTYTGTFTVEGISCTLRLDGTDAAPAEWHFNGEAYTISSGGKSIDCAPGIFPADSFWRLLPELLRQLWSDHTFPQQTETGWQRTVSTQSGQIVLSMGTDENIVILQLPGERGTATLFYNGNA